MPTVEIKNYGTFAGPGAGDGNSNPVTTFNDNEDNDPIQTDDSDFAFIDESKNIGLEIVTIQTTQEGQKDFRSELINIKELKAVAIFAPTYPKEAGQMLKQAQDLGLKIPIFGGDPWGGSRDLIETAGKTAEGVFFTAPMQYEGKEYQEFAIKFKNKYKTISRI